MTTLLTLPLRRTSPCAPPGGVVVAFSIIIWGVAFTLIITTGGRLLYAAIFRFSSVADIFPLSLFTSAGSYLEDAYISLHHTIVLRSRETTYFTTEDVDSVA